MFINFVFAQHKLMHPRCPRLDWLPPHSYCIMGSVINNQNGQSSAREISARGQRNFTLIGRLSTCDSVGAVAFVVTS